MNMGPLPGTPPPTSPGQSQSHGPAARAGQIRRIYLLPYENFPAHGSFSIFLQTLTYAVIITSYHQLHISSNTNIYSHHYLLPPVVDQRSPRSSQSPHYCLNWGQYGNIPAHSISRHTSTLTARENYCTEFVHSAYLVTPQKLKS